MADIAFPTAKVVFRAAAIAQDSDDSGSIPQEILLGGIRVTLIPDLKYVEVAAPPGGVNPTTYSLRTLNLITTNDGNLINMDDPEEEVLIVASDAFPGHVVSWKSIIEDPSGTLPPIIKKWLAPAGSIVDLTTVISVPNNPDPIVHYLQAVYDAREARDKSIQAAADAERAVRAAMEVEQVTLTSNIAYALPAGVAPNSVHSVVFTQNSTGGHTVTYDGQPVTVDLTAGASTTVELYPVGVGYAIRYPVTNLDAQVSALAEDGGSALGASLSSTYARTTTMGVVTLGDSRMARDGSVTAPLPGETAVYNSDRGIFTWANTILRKRFTHLVNGGMGGDTVAQMLARVDALLANYHPGWVVGFGHINSVSANLTAAAIIADLTTIFDKIAASGARVVWGTDWPAVSSTTPQRAVLYAVNEWLRGQTATRRGFSLVDYQSVLVDPTTGNPLAAYQTDGLHQESAGALVLGQQLATVLGALTARSDRLIASNDDPTNLITNGMLTGNSSGTASGWGSSNATLVGTRTKVARTDGFPGEWQQNAVAGASGWYFFRWQLDIGATLAVGDVIRFECEFETDAADWAAKKFYAQISAQGSFAGGTVVQSADHLHMTGAALSLDRINSGIFRTPPFTVPTEATRVQAGVLIEGGAGTFRVARARLWKP